MHKQVDDIGKAVRDLAMVNLLSRDACCVVRFGDGEGRVLLWPDNISRQEIDRHLLFWFGSTDFSDEQIDHWRCLLHDVADAADVIGYYRGMDRNRYWRAPASVLCRSNVIVGENRLHRDLLTGGYLNALIDEADRVVLVTCRTGVDIGRPASIIPVPEEAHTLGRANGHVSQFPAIRQEVKARSGPGVLVLVGAGLFGKIYCMDAKEYGGVAIDIGSIFDVWAGVQSRSYIRSIP
jgi:hypothetical protein